MQETVRKQIIMPRSNNGTLQETIAAIFPPNWENEEPLDYKIPEEAIHAHEDEELKLVHESWLWRHQYYVLAKILELRKQKDSNDSRIEHVVDIGCGKARLLRNLRLNEKQYDRVTYIGIDARQVWEGIDSESAFVNCNVVETWPLNAEAVDCIVMSEFVEHLDRKANHTVLSEACKALRPGGYLILTTFVQHDGVNMECDRLRYGHSWYWARERGPDLLKADKCGGNPEQTDVLQEFLKESGLSVIDSFYSNWFPTDASLSDIEGIIPHAADLIKNLAERYGEKLTTTLLEHVLEPITGRQPRHVQLLAQKRAPHSSGNMT